MKFIYLNDSKVYHTIKQVTKEWLPVYIAACGVKTDWDGHTRDTPPKGKRVCEKCQSWAVHTGKAK